MSRITGGIVTEIIKSNCHFKIFTSELLSTPLITLILSPKSKSPHILETLIQQR